MANVSTLNNQGDKIIKTTVSKTKKEEIDYKKIDQMTSFNEFVKKKNTFLFGVAALFLTLYILLPILAFTPVLQQKWIGNITGVWVYAACLFVMTVMLCMLYTKMAPKFDKMAAEVLAEYKGGAK
ncbi:MULTISPECIES: DUF485 domain-containing protein [Lysinibacillus]|uniref:DUF485 domain-containing protein n=1 Tax=Lysinibacillus antri TaxID=2498145 RepID=A0A3S0RHF2_9BACI|nr:MULTISPECIES: DUF485 domain-containing protein [Lysinibacillus]RUL48646.1 DUF485 domain-containing protein [Lysinibacillus antri]TSI09696.1 DUF485 domain-containing protein [Lysinibacillus sp. BW-2-10]